MGYYQTHVYAKLLLAARQYQTGGGWQRTLARFVIAYNGYARRKVGWHTITTPQARQWMYTVIRDEF